MKLRVTRAQQKVIQSKARYIGVFAGRRWGKTFVARFRIISRALEKPGAKIWYVTPTYSQLLKEFRALSAHPVFSKYIAKTRLQPYPEIILHNGSEIGYRTFDRPENLKGHGLDEVWVDEIQDIAEDAFWPVIRPLLSDRRGTLIISGQFRGKNWYYEQLYMPGQPGPKSKAPRYESFRFPSSSGIAFQSELGRLELDDAKQQLPRMQFDQEYECVPIANQKAVFDPEDLKRILRGTPSVAKNGHQYVTGVDLGRVKDHTAIVVIEKSKDKTIPHVIVHAEKIPLGVKHEEQSKIVARVASRYSARVVIDATGGATGGHSQPDAVFQFYRKLMPSAQPIYWNRAGKQRLIEHLMLNVEQARISIPPAFSELLKELAAYEFEYRAGYYDFHAQSGAHDDYVAALAMALYTTDRGGPLVNGAGIEAAFG